MNKLDYISPSRWSDKGAAELSRILSESLKKVPETLSAGYVWETEIPQTHEEMFSAAEELAKYLIVIDALRNLEENEKKTASIPGRAVQGRYGWSWVTEDGKQRFYEPTRPELLRTVVNAADKSRFGLGEEAA